jgi:Sulfotransferase family
VPDYSPLDKLLHHLALGSRMRAEILHDFERNVFLKSAPPDEGRHVFVTGLARAGTTIVMREVHSSGAFGSLTYADMPFVLAPNFWHGLSAKGRTPGARTERAHGDGIEVDLHSPEALDEVYWRIFSGSDYIRAGSLVPHEPSEGQIQGYRNFIRLVLRRTGKRRYLSKNNNNLLRLASLAAAFPDAITLVPIRHPLDHARSLLRQHRRFLQSDAFTRAYMGWLAHHEFGATHRPFVFDGETATGDPLSLEYWLAYWIAVHHRIERLEREHANIQLVPYDALISDAHIWPAIAKRIEIPPAPLKEIRYSADWRAGQPLAFPREEIGTGATELYQRLDQHARQSLGFA